LLHSLGHPPSPVLIDPLLPQTLRKPAGDGKLGLLVAQVLVVHGCKVTLVGRNENKLALVQGLHASLLLPPSTSSSEGTGSVDPLAELEGKFELVVEASGTSSGISAALKLTRPLGTVVLKSTVSVAQDGEKWAAVANDVVVNEKVLVGSRCGPMDTALKMMAEREEVLKLLRKMVSRCYTIEEGVQAIEHAATKGTLKVQMRMPIGMM
jgi:threonine dehydrogenase-like Zn-dependent dehydrogenase